MHLKVLDYAVQAALGLLIGLSLFLPLSYGQTPIGNPEDCESHDVQVKFTYYEESFYERLSDPESGVRLNPDGSLYLHFFREPPPGVLCRVNWDDERRYICLDPATGAAMGEPVVATQDCPLYDQFRAEFDAAGTKSEKHELSNRYFKSFEPCLGKLNFERLNEALSIRGSAPLVGDALLDCNAEEAEGASLWAHVVDVEAQPFMGIPYRARLWHQNDPFYRDCKYTLIVNLAGPITDDGRCLSPEAQDLLQSYEFWITPDERTPFERETEERQIDFGPLYRGEISSIQDMNRLQLQSFHIKPGVSLAPDEIFNRYADQLKLRDQKDELQVAWTIDGPQGKRHDWYQQHYEGYPVLGGGYRLQSDAGNVTSVTGRIVPRFEETVPDPLPETDALEYALLAVPAKEYAWTTQGAPWVKTAPLEEPKGKLVWVPTKVVSQAEDYRLAWEFTIFTSIPVGGFRVLIDATDGEVLDKESLVAQSEPTFLNTELMGETIYYSTQNFHGGQWITTDDTEPTQYGLWWNGPPIVVTYGEVVETSTDNAGNETKTSQYNVISSYSADFTTPVDAIFAAHMSEAVSIQWGLEQCTRYFYDRFQWSGFDGLGSVDVQAILISPDTEKYLGADGTPSNGAFYNIAADPHIVILAGGEPGELPLVDLDTICHEFGHAVALFNLKNLAGEPRGFISRGESGAIGEGLADIFATLATSYIEGTEPDWILSEDDTPPDGIRNFRDPSRLFDPDTYHGDHYKSYEWNAMMSVDCTSLNDRCGIHNNSTILSHWFYLLYEGGSGTNDMNEAYAVQGIGREKAEWIVWMMMRTKLRPEDDFYQARIASISVAEEMYGPDSSMPDPTVIQAVKDAWHAVGIGARDDPRHLLPEQNSIVDPWPTTIELEIMPDELEYELQFFPFEEDPAFTKQALLAEARRENRPGKVDYYFEPGVGVVWRLRAMKDSGEWAPWTDYRLFFTKKKVPKLIAPERPSPMSQRTYAEVNPWTVEFQWETVKGANQYYLSVTESSELDCEAPETLDPSDTRKIVTLDRPPEEIVDGEVIGKKITLEPEKDYYWSVAAVKPELHFPLDPAEVPPSHYCSPRVRIRTKEVAAPTLLTPHEGEQLPLDDAASVGFEWSPVEGAASYQIYVVPREESGQAMNIFDETTPAIQEIVAAPEASQSTVETQLQGAAGFANGACWNVRAAGPNGSFGKWAEHLCYDIALAAPQLSSPKDDAILTYGHYEIADYLWVSVPGSVAYNLYSYERTADGTRLLHQTSVSDPEGAALPPHVMRYEMRNMSLAHDAPAMCWTVEAVGNHGVTGPKAETECFSVRPSQPQTISVHRITPLGDVVSYAYELSFGSDHAPGGYRVRADVYRDESFTNLGWQYESDIIHAPTQGGPAVWLQSFPEGTWVRWQVTTLDPYAGGTDLTSDVEQFPVDKRVEPTEPEPEPETQAEAEPETDPTAANNFGCPPNYILLQRVECAGSPPDPCEPTGNILDAEFKCYPSAVWINPDGTCYFADNERMWVPQLGRWICYSPDSVCRPGECD